MDLSAFRSIRGYSVAGNRKSFRTVFHRMETQLFDILRGEELKLAMHG